MTHTAIDWLIDELKKAGYIPKDSIIMDYVFSLAKEKEKQQIISALKEGVNIEVRGAQQYQRTFEEYYKETFKKK